MWMIPIKDRPELLPTSQLCRMPYGKISAYLRSNGTREAAIRTLRAVQFPSLVVADQKCHWCACSLVTILSAYLGRIQLPFHQFLGRRFLPVVMRYFCSFNYNVSRGGEL